MTNRPNKEKIVKECTALDKDFEKIKAEAEYLSIFYVTTRYPGDYPRFDFKTAEIALKKALKIKNFVLSKINE